MQEIAVKERAEDTVLITSVAEEHVKTQWRLRGKVRRYRRDNPVGKGLRFGGKKLRAVESGPSCRGSGDVGEENSKV